MKFRADRVAHIGLLALGIALPCGIAGYFTVSEGRDAGEIRAPEAGVPGAPGPGAGRVEIGARAAAGPTPGPASPAASSAAASSAAASAASPAASAASASAASPAASAAASAASAASAPASAASAASASASAPASAASASAASASAASPAASTSSAAAASPAASAAASASASAASPAASASAPASAAPAATSPTSAASAASAAAASALAPAASAASSAAASVPTSSTLALRAETLLSDDAGLRAESAHWLSHLDSDALAAVVARLTELSTHRPAADSVARIFASLAKNDSDSEPAVAAANLLERERTPAVLAVIEPLLYLRSLETMVGGEGHSALALFVELDAGAWAHELTHTTRRLGHNFVPALIGMRSHESQAVRRFAAEQLAALGCTDPKGVLSGTDPYVLARAIRAYASPPDYAAMPGIVRLAGDARIQVRRAARDAVRRFGRNAIWQLRELYDEVSGQPADKHWDHERTADELYAVLDRSRVEEADTLLARGSQALTRGDLAAMRRDFDALLAKYPDFERRDELAAGYAALGEHLFRHDQLSASLAAYRRALRLAPETVDAKRWQAQVAFVAAEYSLTRGVVDLTGYTRALQLDPSLREARDAIERLSGTRTRHVRDMRRMAAVLAFVLLLGCVVILLRRTPTDRTSRAHATSTLPETESEPSG